MGARSLNIALVTYPWPPQPSVGHVRWQSLTAYLREMGVEVDVITTGAFGGMPEDERVDVIRTRDLAAVGVARRALKRPPLATGGKAAERKVPPGSALTKGVVPDPYLVSWVPWAMSATARLIRRKRVDCVVTTSPYDSTHLVGFLVRKLGPAWLADFRDPWTFESVRQAFPLRVQQRLDEWMEQTLVRASDRIVANQEPVLDDFESRLGVIGGYVPNGWDPRWAPAD